MLRLLVTTLICAMAAASAQIAPALAQSDKPSMPSQSRIPTKEKINAWTVGLAAGRTEGAPLRLAAELARELDDGDEMRLVPMVTRGPYDNVFDLLHLRGVDLAIVSGDILEFFKKDPAGSAVQKRISYIMPLVPAEVHILVGPGIKSIEDLAGKAVNFNTAGTQAAYSGPLIFERLGIKVEQHFVPHSVAMAELLKGGKYAATFWVSSKPLDPFVKRKFPEGFKLLPVEFSEKLQDYYLPAYLEPQDYPDLIPAGTRVSTIAVPTVLAAYNHARDNDRYRRQVRFVDYLFARLENLQNKPGFDPKWKDINLAASVPGWQRFAPVQAKLDGATDVMKPNTPVSGIAKGRRRAQAQNRQLR